MNGHVNPFAVTAGAFVGACFPPMLGWCGHHEFSFSASTLHKIMSKGQHGPPGPANDAARHDDSPPGKTDAGLGPMAESRLYKIAHLQSFAIELCLPYSNRPHYRTTSSSNRLSA